MDRSVRSSIRLFWRFAALPLWYFPTVTIFAIRCIHPLTCQAFFELRLSEHAKLTVIFSQPGVVVLGCNIHDWMGVWVL
jgi:hypothetical protein